MHKYNPSPLPMITSVAYILDNEKNEPVLFVDCVPGLFRNTHKFVCFAKEEEARDPKLKGHFFGLVYIDPAYYDIFIRQFPKLGKIMFMHELGHYLNGDYKIMKSNRNLDEDRLECIKQGKVQGIELAADRFAIDQCGLDNFLCFIDCMIKLRKGRENDPGREFALKEYELRKEAALREFGNQSNNSGLI